MHHRGNENFNQHIVDFELVVHEYIVGYVRSVGLSFMTCPDVLTVASGQAHSEQAHSKQVPLPEHHELWF